MSQRDNQLRYPQHQDHHPPMISNRYRQESSYSSAMPQVLSHHHHHQPLYTTSYTAPMGIMPQPPRSGPFWQQQQQPHPNNLAPPPRGLSSRPYSNSHRTAVVTPPLIRSSTQKTTSSRANGDTQQDSIVKIATTSTTKKPSSVKTTSSPRTAKITIDTSLPAIAVVQPAPVDSEYEVMAAGLKLQQQDWLEKVELKKIISDVARLVDCLHSSLTSDSTSYPPIDELKEIINHTIGPHLELFQMRVSTKLQQLERLASDLEGHSRELTARSLELSELRDGNLASVVSELHRAKRRRRFHLEFEHLASQCLSKKPRHVYEEEEKKEQEKLEKVQKETALWKDIGEFRNRQVDVSLLHVKDLLDSLKNPQNVIELIQLSKTGNRILDTGKTTNEVVNTAY